MSRSAASPRITPPGQGGANWSRAGPQSASSGSSAAIRMARGAHPGLYSRADIRYSEGGWTLLAPPQSLPTREGAAIVPAGARMDNTPQEARILQHFGPAA